MPLMKRNEDGTTSIVHSDDEIIAAGTANATTEIARVEQMTADAERARSMSAARVAAAIKAAQLTDEQAASRGADLE